MTHNKKAFTLVELLVVISIIAILIALLLPALAAARQYAVQVICLSNMRQTYLASSEYANDNLGYYPPSIADVGQIGPTISPTPYSLNDETAAYDQFQSRWDTGQIYGPLLSEYVGGPPDDAASNPFPMDNFNANDAVLACPAILANPARLQLYNGRVDPFVYAYCYAMPSEGRWYNNGGITPLPRQGLVTEHDMIEGSTTCLTGGPDTTTFSSAPKVHYLDFMFACSYPAHDWVFGGAWGQSIHQNNTAMNFMEVDGGTLSGAVVGPLASRPNGQNEYYISTTYNR